MSISGSVLRNRAVLLIYLRAVSNSYFTVGCFNSERAVQAQRPHPGCAGGWPPAKGFLSSRRWAEQPDYSKPAPRRRGATAVAFVLITRGAVVVMPHCGKSQLILGEKGPKPPNCRVSAQAEVFPRLRGAYLHFLTFKCFSLVYMCVPNLDHYMGNWCCSYCSPFPPANEHFSTTARVLQGQP